MKPNGFLWADVSGLTLTSEDKEILAHPFISGVILFSRNYESPKQLQELTRQIRAVSPELIITVDQEGGRVQRFREGFTELPSMRYWAEKTGIGDQGSGIGRESVGNEKMILADTKSQFSKTLSIMVNELRSVGVYASLLPVLDIDYNRNQVIGHRSFGNQAQVMRLGEWMIDQFHQLKMPVTAKHFPGHGWVTADSHVDLPIDERSFDEIAKHDLQPFQKMAAKCDAMMLAHVIYSQVDPNPVCFSRFWIQDVLQKQLQFKGLIISDDLSMQAVARMGSYADRAMRALESGCDILLVCNARNGVIDILDHVTFNHSAHFIEKLSSYARFLA